tara:strand:+ start:67 stop:552 length:486 start_codon:yes stop_codon:yes gene_type:complete
MTITVNAAVRNTKGVELGNNNSTHSLTHHPKSTKLIFMRNLTATLCLTITVLLESVGVGLGAEEFPNSLDGLCLDNLEEGCMPRYLPLKGHKISYCEASCDLTNPVKTRGMDGVLYDLSCTTDDSREYPARVMLLRQKNGKSGSMSWIDQAGTYKIVRCPK